MSAVKAAASKKAGEPGPEEQAEDPHAVARELEAFLASPRQARALAFCRSLKDSPPQVLLLEGGSARERKLAALHWATSLNCSSPAENSGVPCLSCPSCLRILGRTHRDFLWLDGEEGSIKIEDVRQIRSIIGEAPREAETRVIVLAEAQALTEAAANAMLKSLEEPRPGTVFVLLAPQRERLLPTLVSRSWVLTLAWPEVHGADRSQAEKEWEAALFSFVQSGTGLFEKTGARGSMDAAAAQAALLVCQRALAEALAGPQGGAAESGNGQTRGLVRFFASLGDERRRMADEAMAEVQDSLGYMVNPALAVEWLATRLYLLSGKR